MLEHSKSRSCITVMAPVGDTLLESSFAAQTGPPDAPDPVTGPTALFWMVCFALNAAAAPSGSVCGLGYEPNWILRMSPVAQLFDGLHMVLTWFMAYRTFGGSARMATAATLLGRLGSLNAPEAMWRTITAREALSNLTRSAEKVDSLVTDIECPQQRQGEGSLGGQGSPIQPRDLEKARGITQDLVRNTIATELPFDQIQLHDARKALDQLQALEVQALEARFLLWQLIVSGDSAAQKERIRRSVARYISHVDNVKGWVELFMAAGDVAKARSRLIQITKEAFFRWFCFVLGVFPQALKLFGSSGIMPLQMCGAAFLCPWIIFEVMVGAARILGLEESAAKWILERDIDPGQHELLVVLALHIASEVNRVLLRVYKLFYHLWHIHLVALVGRCVPIREFKRVIPLYSFPWTGVSKVWKGFINEVRKPGPRERLIRYWVYSSIVLGCAGILGHIMFMVYVLPNEDLAIVFSNFYPLLIPVWVDDLGSLLSRSHGDASRLEGVVSSKVLHVLSSFQLIKPNQSPHEIGATKDEISVGIPTLIMIAAVSAVVSIMSRTRTRFGQRLPVVLRLGLFCAPSMYYILVLYEEEGTKLLPWAEWLG